MPESECSQQGSLEPLVLTFALPMQLVTMSDVVDPIFPAPIPRVFVRGVAEGDLVNASVTLDHGGFIDSRDVFLGKDLSIPCKHFNILRNEFYGAHNMRRPIFVQNLDVAICLSISPKERVLECLQVVKPHRRHTPRSVRFADDALLQYGPDPDEAWYHAMRISCKEVDTYRRHSGIESTGMHHIDHNRRPVFLQMDRIRAESMNARAVALRRALDALPAELSYGIKGVVHWSPLTFQTWPSFITTVLIHGMMILLTLNRRRRLVLSWNQIGCHAISGTFHLMLCHRNPVQATRMLELVTA